MIKGPPTPKGFRDILPELAKKRRNAINKIVAVLEEFGFVPIETPTVEFAETLLGKYGEEERLIYQFKDRGGRNLALRYDLTVPLARFVASNLNLIAKEPFRRYQIGQVFRGENPQKGRWREFTQFDFDTVGSNDSSEDAKIIAAAIKSIEALGIKNFKILINDREIFKKLSEEGFVKDEQLITVLRSLDKIKKIGDEGVIEELQSKGFTEESARSIVSNAKTLKENDPIVKIINSLKKMGIDESKYIFDPTLARGLDYYTSTIIEAEVDGYARGSVGGGGRYDNLIGSFAKKQIPAVGFSFGIDRLIELIP